MLQPHLAYELKHKFNPAVNSLAAQVAKGNWKWAQENSSIQLLFLRNLVMLQRADVTSFCMQF